MGEAPHRHRSLIAAIGVLALLAAAAPAFARELTIEQRIEHQRAIEQVYWNHRVWPKENPGPKPPLSAVMPDAALRARVEDYLKKSNALGKHWQRPVTAEQLQAEMDRMARDTRDGATLIELFRALNDDPYVIAETLARQMLVDRLIHNWYAVDTRFHDGEMTTASVTWPERSFESWWAAEARAIGSTIETSSTSFASPSTPSGTCTNDTWSAFGTEVPVPRSEHTAVWTGAEMIVWGGHDGDVSLNTGGRYNPTTDTWAATSTGTSVPSARSGHAAVWTGTEMIIWGGAINNTGGRYNPTTDTWAATYTGTNAPAGRANLTAVWTGTEMIVWGGKRSDNQNVLSGGRYNPSTNTWMLTSLGANIPSARQEHTAVWTGTEMIVWGGAIATNTGGRYDPPMDTWAPTSIGVDVPSPRDRHTAVWTGSEMIVWGGSGNSGGRYHPPTDTWLPTSTGTNVPQGRSDHTAVWTGSEMIVWGGSVNTGGRYNPSTNTWTPTSTGDGVPTARTSSSAVWTGRQMIVWGGFPRTATGGVYCACPDGQLGYRDADDDGFGNYAASVAICSGALPAGYVADSSDCDDANSSIVRFTFYRDADGDGHGNSGMTAQACIAPGGYVTTPTDCDDTNAGVRPGGVEVCDGRRNDCEGAGWPAILDNDGDVIENACDPCPNAPGHEDPDGDGVCSSSDNCPTVANSGQGDLDNDGLGDPCDNCIQHYNADQTDFDHNGVGDTCDLSDGLILIFFMHRDYIAWQEESGPTTFNVYGGDLDELRATGVYTQVPGSNVLADRRCELYSTGVEDSEQVPPGKVKFSLVTGKTEGVEGTLGSNGAGVERPNSYPCW